MTDTTAAAADEAERSFDALQAQAAQAQADADAKAQEPRASTRKSAADRLAEALTGEAAHAAAPAGYDIRWPKPAFDLLKRNDTAPEGSPAWLVRCNAHGTTTPVQPGKNKGAQGALAVRVTWCRKCKAEAAKAARAEAKAQAEAPQG